MKSLSIHIDNLIQAFRCLPGIGPKSAQRLTYFLLERDRQGGYQLSEALLRAMDAVKQCQICRSYTDHEICWICSDESREKDTLCVVESPLDLLALEATAAYRGQYFVLHGFLSPLDGIGPDELGLPLLQQRLEEKSIRELVLATNTTIEGEATAHYISDMADGLVVEITRLASGIPMGGELEYIDGSTLAKSFLGRQKMV
ncbi:MAG: recombination mediator RecR [Pseudomonadota bacterium]